MPTPTLADIDGAYLKAATMAIFGKYTTIHFATGSSIGAGASVKQFAQPYHWAHGDSALGRASPTSRSSSAASLNLRRARRTSTAPSVECISLRLPEAWRAAPLLLTRSAQLAQPTVRLPQLSQRWARPHWPSVTCAAACVSDTARRLPAHCETMGVR